MTTQSLYQTFKRYRSLQTDVITALPIAILMPHSACNCRCVMCDIWKDNAHLRQLNEKDIAGLLTSFRKLGTRQVLMSGGEALLNPNFFRFCEILRGQGIRISLLSTGLTLERHASSLTKWVQDVIISLDGDESLHNQVRRIPGAFGKMRTGIQAIRDLDPNYKITARSVIHRQNFRNWARIIDSAHQLEVDQVSFLPADVTSHAFNREVLWSEQRVSEVLPGEKELDELRDILESMLHHYVQDLQDGFIAESPDKLRRIYHYYAAFYGRNPFPYKRCNAPWVSAVVEADGTVRPCFFHQAIGNIRDSLLEDILNKKASVGFRKMLDVNKDPTCEKCVCYLHLSPGQLPG